MRLLKTTYKELADEQLVLEIQNGKELAFQELYDRYAKHLYQYFYRRMWKDSEKAEDFVHDLFTKLIQNPNAFDTTRSFKTWVFSVANNMTINEYKKQAVRQNVHRIPHKGAQSLQCRCYFAAYALWLSSEPRFL